MPASLGACARVDLRVGESSRLSKYDKCTDVPTRKSVCYLRKMVRILSRDLASRSLALSNNNLRQMSLVMRVTRGDHDEAGFTARRAYYDRG